MKKAVKKDPRNIVIKVLVNEEERARIAHSARICGGFPLAGYLRWLALGAPLPESRRSK